MSYFDNDLVRDVYRSLFRIAVDLEQNKSWDGIAKQYRVDGSAGCLHRLSEAILAGVGPDKVGKKVGDVCRLTLENFLHACRW